MPIKAFPNYPPKEEEEDSFPSAEEGVELLVGEVADGMAGHEDDETPELEAEEIEDDDFSDLVSDVDTPEMRRAAMSAVYGSDFPLCREDCKQDDFGPWVDSLVVRHEPGKRKRLHLNERNRLFRQGIQWVSSQRQGPWKEPVRSGNTVRFTYNLVGPALDQRVQIIAEQRPGFKTRPVTSDPDDKRRAEAQQDALEYQYTEQKMAEVCREASYWAGTDGASFLMTYWDTEAGPWHEHLDGVKRPLGDLRTRVVRFEQVFVSANATANETPHYWVVREEIPLAQAVQVYGSKALDNNSGGFGAGSGDAFGMGGQTMTRSGFELPGINELYRDQETVTRDICFCAPSEYLPQGLTVVSVGGKVLSLGPLLFGVVPMVRWTDGSSDPAFFPAPRMDGWIELQMLLNVTLSKWIESVRQNAGGRFLTKPRALVAETLVGGLLSAIEVRTSGAIGDSIQQVQGMSIGGDAEKLLALVKSAFEDVSGYSAMSRGKFAEGASGRAILAARESLERIFSEEVNQNARATTAWAKVNLHGMQWGYDIERTVGVFGTARADLARALTQDDFDGVADVWVDPETIMPMPRAMKLFLLDQMLERQIITPQEYSRRMPWASVRNLDSRDEDHSNRARRVVDAIKSGQPVPALLWVDNEAIHQDILEREIMLNDDLPEEVRAAATQRWTELAGQFAQKNGAQPPAPGAPQGGGQPDTLPPTQAPMLANNPSVATAPVAVSTGFEEGQQTALMDRTSPY